MKSKFKAAEILESAAAVIQGGFWTQRTFARATRRVIVSGDSPAARQWCALGALIESADGLRLGHKAYELAENTLIGLTNKEEVAQWNDAPGRTHEEVANAMWQAAAQLRGEA